MKNIIAFLLFVSIYSNCSGQFVYDMSIDYVHSPEMISYHHLELDSAYFKTTEGVGGYYGSFYVKNRLFSIGPGNISLGLPINVSTFTPKFEGVTLGVNYGLALDYNLGFLGNKFSTSEYSFFVGGGMNHFLWAVSGIDKSEFIDFEDIPRGETIYKAERPQKGFSLKGNDPQFPNGSDDSLAFINGAYRFNNNGDTDNMGILIHAGINKKIHWSGYEDHFFGLRVYFRPSITGNGPNLYGIAFLAGLHK